MRTPKGRCQDRCERLPFGCMATARSPSRADVALAGLLASYALIEGVVIDAPAGWMVGAPLAMLPFA